MTALAPEPHHDFGGRVRRARGQVVVQPRMGFASPTAMRTGLRRTAGLSAQTAGTITLDSYTRLGDYRAVRDALARRGDLNGYPIVTEDRGVTRAMTADLIGPDFQVQVRHGSAAPADIIRAMVDCDLYATEGGPVSYCLPYGRVPLAESIRNWRHACELLAAQRGPDAEPHLETFGGCLMGQLCPPSLLVAVSVLEAMFFRDHGLHSVSLSYAQQTDHEQDIQAIAALRTLAADYLSDVDWHIVLYTYMGVFPYTQQGALSLSRDAARLAARAGADRLIVKTRVEARRIPTIAENIEALRAAAEETADATPAATSIVDDTTLAEARTLIEATLELSEDVGRALLLALRRGYLDVPYCLHPDNGGRARSAIDSRGRLVWAEVGRMPLRPAPGRHPELSSARLLAGLTHVADRYDMRDAVA
ncbi:methylaspartate mutase [Amycolatopsis sp. GM8]|uniref:methylaspartate mutase n=1 Tax=Amycolatopsis sp. GM8 TaxID=2896530 RepID=UPI001F446C27|nr:methylaspartate mutase [Amycolatopsis sp. GM8]